MKKRLRIVGKKIWRSVRRFGKTSWRFCQKGMRFIGKKLRKNFDFKAQRRLLYRSWERAAKKNNVEAIYKLRMLYYEETEEYYPLAFKWTQYWVQQEKDCAAMLQLAQMYDKGHGTAQDALQAKEWYERCLSLHIIQGKKSPLARDAADFIQERIQSLRTKSSGN